MEFLLYLRIISDHKRMIIILCLSAIFHATLITYILSEKFEATALVLIRPQEKVSFGQKEKEAFNFPITYNIPFETISTTFSEILKSEAIAAKVVELLGMDKWKRKKKDNYFHEMWTSFKEDAKKFCVQVWTFLKYGRIEEGDPFSEATGIVKDNISITPTKDTYLFEITYEAKIPGAASLIANSAAEVFVEYSREADRKEAMGARDFFEKQVEISAKELHMARDALQRFKEENDTIAFDEEASSKIMLISEFESSLERNEKELKGLIATTKEMRLQLAKQSEFIKSSSEKTNNPVVTELKSHLARLEIKKSGLLEKFSPSHLEILSLEAEIKETQKKIKKEVKKIIGSETSAINVIHQELIQDLINASTKRYSLEAKKTSILSTISKYKKMIKGFPYKEHKISELTLALKVTKETYKLNKREYENSKAREAKKISEIRVISPATTPLYPTEPIKIYYAGTALVIALTIGVGLAFFFEYIDMTIRTIEDAEEILEVPVISTMPTVKSFSNKSQTVSILSDCFLESKTD